VKAQDNNACPILLHTAVGMHNEQVFSGPGTVVSLATEQSNMTATAVNQTNLFSWTVTENEVR
jgi:hypothetical protein